MSEFLMVVPSDFIELQNAAEWLPTVDPEMIQRLVNERDWNSLSQILENSGVIEQNGTISDARYIDAGDGARFWYKR